MGQVDTEENGVKAAHTALEQVIAAHKAAMLATVSERKVKLEQLAADLKVLQQKMQAMHGASGKSRTSELAASAQVAAVAPAAEVAAHATLADTAKHAAKAAEKRPGVVKALPPNDRAARDPRSLSLSHSLSLSLSPSPSEHSNLVILTYMLCLCMSFTFQSVFFQGASESFSLCIHPFIIVLCASLYYSFCLNMLIS